MFPFLSIWEIAHTSYSPPPTPDQFSSLLFLHLSFFLGSASASEYCTRKNFGPSNETFEQIAAFTALNIETLIF